MALASYLYPEGSLAVPKSLLIQLSLVPCVRPLSCDSGCTQSKEDVLHSAVLALAGNG